MVRPRGFDEDEALHSAMELFWAKGYDATSISDLEHHLGLGRQSIYNVLGDKRQVFLKALDRYTRSSGAIIERLLLHGSGGLDDIRAYLMESLKAIASSSQRRACLVVNTVMENATADPGIGTVCHAMHRLLVRGFRAALERAIERGEIPKRTDVRTTATLLAAQAYGTSVLAKSGMPMEELKRAAAAFVDRLA